MRKYALFLLALVFVFNFKTGVYAQTTEIICPNGNTLSSNCTAPYLPNTSLARIGTAKFFFTQFLNEGSQGNEIVELQKYLTNAGYLAGNADGIFGPKTKAAVIKFQSDHKLKIDGIVGFEVRSVLNR